MRGRRAFAVVVVLAVAAVAFPAATVAAALSCPVGTVPVKINGTPRCIPRPSSTTTGALAAMAGALTSSSNLRAMGARTPATAMVGHHASTLRSFVDTVLTRAGRIKAPAVGDPRKVVKISFPGGEFQGFGARAIETLRPPVAGESGSPRATALAIAFAGALPKLAIRSDADHWVKVSDGLSVRVDLCPSRSGQIFADVTATDVVVTDVGGGVQSFPILVRGSTEVFVDDAAEPTEPFELGFEITAPKNTVVRAVGRLMPSGAQKVALDSFVITRNGRRLPWTDETDGYVRTTSSVVARAANALMSAIASSESYWKAGDCLDASFSPSGPVMRPNDTEDIKVTVRRRDSQNTVRGATLTPTLSPAGSVEPHSAITDTSGGATFGVTAPSTVQTLILHVKGVSRQGVVKGNLAICMQPAVQAPASSNAPRARTDPACQPPQPFFRVVSWSSTETASGTDDPQFDFCTSQGGSSFAPSGTLDMGATLPTAQSAAPADNTLTTSGGFFQGQIQSDGVKTTFSNYTTHHCKFDQSLNIVACDNAIPDKDAPLASDGVSLNGAQGANVKVVWPLKGANIGAVDDACSVFFWNDGADLALEDTETSVPLTTFQTPGEHTITFSGSKHFTRDELGNPASIDYQWDFSLTFEVVFTNG
jgi:hypothetical protein